MIENCLCSEKSPDFTKQCTCTLGIATVPTQQWGKTYDSKTALSRGTLFPDLDLPFYAGGDDHVR